MALPPKVQMDLIIKRLKNKEGRFRVNEIRQIFTELPGYNNGPYGKIKKWLRNELKKTNVRSKIKHDNLVTIRREGHAQFSLVGFPNVGKSSIIHKLTGVQTRIENYAFTTLEPIPGTLKINGAYFQLIDLPGLIEGASQNLGRGRRFLGIVKCCDGILLIHDLTKPLEQIRIILDELKKSEIDKPLIIIGNKIDLDNHHTNFEELKKSFSNNIVVGISTVSGEGLEDLKKHLWDFSNLMRIYVKNSPDPIILKKDSTIKELIQKIHTKLLKTFNCAKVTGPSSKFPNQKVGISHVLKDEDRVDIVFS